MGTKKSTRLTALKNKLGNLVCTMIQSSCATSHVVLSYASDSVEWVEKKSAKRLTGMVEQSTVLDRQHATLKTKHAIAQGLSEFGKAVKAYTASEFNIADEKIINETVK